jgi:putative endonuclease
MSKEAFVYFMTNQTNTTLYIGVTNHLLRRVAEHKSLSKLGFTAKYHCTKLVYFETTDYLLSAIAREKQLKNWKRDWKNELVAKTNPDWRDLAPEIGVTDALVREIAGQARNDATGQARNDAMGQARNDATGQARNDATGQARNDATGQVRIDASIVNNAEVKA